MGNAWKYCCQVFDFLTLAAVIDGKVLCVHGGLSPDVRTLDQIRTIRRDQEIPHEGAFCDLMWSDPEEIETWQVSPRGAGWLFGWKATSTCSPRRISSPFGRRPTTATVAATSLQSLRSTTNSTATLKSLTPCRTPSASCRHEPTAATSCKFSLGAALESRKSQTSKRKKKCRTEK